MVRELFSQLRDLRIVCSSLTTKFVERVTEEFDKEVREPLAKRPRKLSQRDNVKRIDAKQRFKQKGKQHVQDIPVSGGEYIKSWYSRVLDEIRLPVRKLMRFTK
jgi:hypothetical protein